MLEPDGLRQVLVVELERRRQRRIQDLDFVREHFDLAGDEVRIGAAFRAQPHEPGHANHELVAQRLGNRERVDAIRIEDDLDEAFAVAQIDEDHAAVVAAPVHPAHQRDRLAQMAAIDASTIIGAFQIILQRVLRSLRAAWGATRRPRTLWLGATATASSQFRGFAVEADTGSRATGFGAGAGPRRRGATTPIEMMYLSASSTDMSSSRTLSFGTITK